MLAVIVNAVLLLLQSMKRRRGRGRLL